MDLQELISRGRFLLSGAPERLRVFSMVNGRLSAREIAKETSRTVVAVLNDLKKLADVEVVELRRDEDGKEVKKEGSAVYQKVGLARHIPLSYFQDTRKGAKKVATQKPPQGHPAKKAGRRKHVPVPSETEILDICREGEEQLYEFKGPGTEIPKITKEVAALLHTRDGGILFYGVEDDGSIAGTDLSRAKFDQSLQNSLRNTIDPGPNVAIRSAKVLKAEILLVIVPPWNRKTVYLYHGAAYIRRGTNVFRATAREVAQLHKGEYI